jgi:ketosteroid isomerase-like protein
MNRLKAIAVIFLALTFVGSAFAGDKEDVLATLNKTIKDFNGKDYPAYYASFTDEYDVFATGNTPLRHDMASWKRFIDGLATMSVVEYQQQDNVVRVYNGDAATVSGYYVFTVQPPGGPPVVENGRASIIYVKQKGKWLIAHMHFSKLF